MVDSGVKLERQGATSGEIKDRKLDVGVGTFFSNLVMYFIILTPALTLHTHGVTTLKLRGRPLKRSNH
jgi:hypothetical protein